MTLSFIIIDSVDGGRIKIYFLPSDNIDEEYRYGHDYDVVLTEDEKKSLEEYGRFIRKID